MTQRLGTPETLALSTLNLHHRNPRRGSIPAIAESLLTNGQFRPVVVNRGTHTGRPWEVLAGNHTVMAARHLQAEDKWGDDIDTYVVDVQEEEANRIVLADNRTADIGSYDNDDLLGLLEEMEDLSGTGYTDDDMKVLMDLSEKAPSLEDLEEEFGDSQDDDFWPVIRFRVPPHVEQQWKDYANPYDSDEEAFESLLDRGSGYSAPAPGA